MLSPKIKGLLNNQIKLEAESAQIYLAMSLWAANYGLEGTAKWFKEQYHEENEHMLKITCYLNDLGCSAEVPALAKPEKDYKDIKTVFDTTLAHEQMIADSINKIVVASLQEYDITTATFLNWYVLEQIEEERNVRRILDKIKHAGTDPGALLITDKFIGCLR